MTSIDSILETHMKQIRAEIIAFLTGGAAAAATVPAKRGRPAGKIVAKASKKASRKPKVAKVAGEPKAPKAPRAPKADMIMETNDLLGAIRAYGASGAKAEDIIKNSKISKTLAAKVIRAAIRSGRLTKTGSTRSTRYFAADAPVAAAAE